MNTLHHQRLAFCVLHLLTFGLVLKLVTLFFCLVEGKNGFIYQPTVMAPFVN